MSVHYKFKSAKDFSSIRIEGQFISVGTLKERIFGLKRLGRRGTEFDVVVSNAQTNEEYTNEAALIARDTSVLIHRAPRFLRMMPILGEQDGVKAVEDSTQNITPATSNVAPQPSTINPEESEWDDFGGDPFAIIPKGQLAQSFNPAAVSSDKLDVDRKIGALVETPFLDWSSQSDGYGGGKGYGQGMGGRMMGGRGFGRGLFERRNPPPGYVCHRCHVPGHFIQHCPTNGIPAYDVKRVKPPIGIPKSMLIATTDGSYALPNRAVAVLQPDEAAFEKDKEGIPNTTRAVVSTEPVPKILCCPLCKEVMKDAVFTSKCCFKSFCDKCIRDHIRNKSKCVCGATHVLADDLLPNMTVRETICQILEIAATSSQEKAGSFVQVQGMQSAVPVREKVPSSAVSGLTEDPKDPALVECSPEAANTYVAANTSAVMAVNGDDNSKMKALVATDATSESKNGEDPRSLKKSHFVKDNAGKPHTSDEAEKKKQRPRDDSQWGQYQEMGGVDGFGGMQMAGPGSNLFLPSFTGLPPGPFGGVFPPVPDPFMAYPYFNLTPPVPRDLAGLALGNVGMNMGPPQMVRQQEDFEGGRVHFNRERDMENHRRDVDKRLERSERERRDLPRDRHARREGREVPSAREGSPASKHVSTFESICCCLHCILYILLLFMPVSLCNLLLFAFESVGRRVSKHIVAVLFCRFFYRRRYSRYI